MILARIMKAVRVRRDYEIEIDFTVDFEKIGGITHLGLMQEEDTILLPDSKQKVVSF